MNMWRRKIPRNYELFSTCYPPRMHQLFNIHFVVVVILAAQCTECVRYIQPKRLIHLQHGNVHFIMDHKVHYFSSVHISETYCTHLVKSVHYLSLYPVRHHTSFCMVRNRFYRCMKYVEWLQQCNNGDMFVPRCWWWWLNARVSFYNLAIAVLFF